MTRPDLMGIKLPAQPLDSDLTFPVIPVCPSKAAMLGPPRRQAINDR
jgi:hypothetical protein